MPPHGDIVHTPFVHISPDSLWGHHKGSNPLSRRAVGIVVSSSNLYRGTQGALTRQGRGKRDMSMQRGMPCHGSGCLEEASPACEQRSESNTHTERVRICTRALIVGLCSTRSQAAQTSAHKWHPAGPFERHSSFFPSRLFSLPSLHLISQRHCSTAHINSRIPRRNQKKIHSKHTHTHGLSQPAFRYSYPR